MLYQSAFDHHEHCSLPHNEDEGDWWTDLDDAFVSLMKDMHQGKGKKKVVINESTTLARAEILANAMLDGYGTNFLTTDYDSPDLEMLKNLKNNVWAFSGYSDFQMVQDLSAALLDKDGKLRSESDFFAEAEKIGKTYNRDRLRVERNHAIATSQMAAKWVEYQNNADILPNLRYKTVGDDRVRQAHRALDNIVRPIDDAFWNTYYPPNDWGCRCDVQQEDGRITNLEGKNLPPVKPMFRTNLAKTGQLYPDGHPYFNTNKENTKDIDDALDSLANHFQFTPDNIKKDYADKLDITLKSEIFSYLNSPVPFKTGKGPGAYFDPDNWFVFVPMDERRKQSKWKAESVIYHEYGHASDWQNGLKNDARVRDLMDRYRKKFSHNNDSLYRSIIERVDSIGYFAAKKGWYDLMNMCGAASDTIMSLNPEYGFGHPKSYWEKEGYKEAEFIAHMFENRFAGNPLFKKVMPELYGEMIKLTDDLHPLRQK